MTTEAESTFAGDFPPATEEQWLALVDKVLKGAPRSKLESATPAGLPVHPLYTRSDAPGGGDVAGVPGAAPFSVPSPAGSPSPLGSVGSSPSLLESPLLEPPLLEPPLLEPLSGPASGPLVPTEPPLPQRCCVRQYFSPGASSSQQPPPPGRPLQSAFVAQLTEQKLVELE